MFLIIINIFWFRINLFQLLPSNIILINSQIKPGKLYILIMSLLSYKRILKNKVLSSFVSLRVAYVARTPSPSAQSVLSSPEKYAPMAYFPQSGLKLLVEMSGLVLSSPFGRCRDAHSLAFGSVRPFKS